MKALVRSLLVALAAVVVCGAVAGETEVRRALAPLLFDARIVSVQKLPTLELFEVAVKRSDGTYRILYADPKGELLIFGNSSKRRRSAISPKSGCANSRRSTGTRCRFTGGSRPGAAAGAARSRSFPTPTAPTASASRRT
jgi:hypothetical protein